MEGSHNSSAAPPAGRLLHWPWMMLPLVVAAASRGLWAPDEPRYAEIARELVRGGDWLFLRLCGEPYADKPPLFFWLAALAGWLSGWSELALRSVSLLASAGTAWIVAALARRWWGQVEAALAPALFLGCLLITGTGSRVQIDPLLTLATTAALALADAPVRTRASAGRRALWAGLATGLAALAKGPVAWAVIGLVLLVWRTSGNSSGGARARVRDLAWAVLLAILPVVLWAGGVAMREPTLARELFFEQHLGRTLQAMDHPGPFWKHAARVPLYLAPWTLPMLLGLLQGLGSLRFARDERDRGLVRAALWLIVLLLFFSAIPEKRELYLLPAMPAAALLGGRWLRVAMDEGLPAWVAWFGVACLGLLAGAGCGLMPAASLAGSEALQRLADLDLGGRALGAGIVFAAATLVAARMVRTGKALAWINVMLASWAFGLALALGLLMPVIDRVKSPRAIATWVASLPDQPQRIPCWGIRPEGFRFYADLPAVKVDELSTDIRLRGPRFLALVEAEQYAFLTPDERSRVKVVRRTRIGSREVLVLRSSENPSEAGEAASDAR